MLEVMSGIGRVVLFLVLDSPSHGLGPFYSDVLFVAVGRHLTCRTDPMQCLPKL